MSADVSFGQSIVDEVAEDLSQQDTNNRGEVQEPELLEIIAVTAKLDGCGKENGCANVDADCPAKADETTLRSANIRRPCSGRADTY
jgi:hypothetical protein